MSSEIIQDTTRVCIKNVPPNFSEAKLRSHLTSNSQRHLIITDCKILRTQDGKSRKLAFVGFKDVEMANHVIKHFDKSFALTSKLQVEPAFSKGQKDVPKPWSKHSAVSSRNDKGQSACKDTSLSDEKPHSSSIENNDDVLQRKKKEFVDVMLGGKDNSSNLFWANDDAKGGKDVEKESENIGVEDNESIVSSSRDSDDDSVDVMNTYKKEISDMDFLRSKVLSTKEHLSDDDDDKDSKNDEEDDESVSSSSESGNDEIRTSQKTDPFETIDASSYPETEQTDRLFIRNLPFSTTEDDIKELYSKYGNIIECHIPVDDSNRNKGYAFVRFQSAKEASAAKTNLDGTAFQGRLMHVLNAQKPKKDQESHDDLELSHKEKSEMQRQQDAGNATGWSSSFIRGDAVVDNLASRLGLDKGVILNVKDDLSSGNAAVRLALGETHIIEENRTFFKNHGVDMDALVSPNASNDKKDNIKRSNTMILVKNLPFDTSLEELSKIFVSVGGDAPKVLLPPSKTIALVIYIKATDAKRAFRKLAYKRFKHVPLYLEWAPKLDLEKIENIDNEHQGKVEKQQLQLEEEEVDLGEIATIYVKNLNFCTTEDELKIFFEERIGDVRACRIPMKISATKGLKSGGTNPSIVKQSMGFGFVEFNSSFAAKKALKNQQGAILDGHSLELSVSKSGAGSLAERYQGASISTKKSTKLIVRNVPFQATRKEILQLFSSFSQLKRVTLPKKYDGSHRGFAFVEFSGAQEARNAKEALSQTHLYGRHLVLEWAEDADDIDNLREKVKRDSTASTPKNKKIRFE